MKKINVMNALKNMKSEFKAGYSESKARYDAKFEAAVVKAEEAGYKAVKAVYTPAYAVGYAADAIATTKVAKHVANAVENVKFSAKEGYADGKEAHLNAMVQNSQEVQVTQFRQALEEVANIVAQQGAEDEQYAVYYEGNDAICGDGVWTGATAF